MTGATTGGPEHEATVDELFHALGAAPRRVTLFHLRQNGAATMRELTDVAAELLDVEREVGATGTRGRRRLRTALEVYHLPLLERYGLVVYDRIRDIVEATPAIDGAGAWLDLAVTRALTSTQPDGAARQSTDAMTVLVVDDDPDLVELVQHVVGEKHPDIEVETATSAPDAFATLNARSIDCVVSDYWMPAIDGLDLLRAIREEFPTLPFILFTNKGSEAVASQAIANDVTAYVPKGTGTEQYDRLVQQIRLAVDRTR
jgi:CheY-like chemotaxis protein